MIDFLLTKNAAYCAADLEFSQDNMDALFEDLIQDKSVPNGVELCCLPDGATEPGDSFANRGEDRTAPVPVDSEGLVMEAVGYTVRERTPQDARNMKASAVAWCLDKKQFIKTQSGSKFMSDRDSNLLTYTFPNLNPWGIGGFYEPNRTESQHISFERQVKSLLLHHGGRFQKDPNFTYVCWNIIQKKEVNKHVHFRTNAKDHATVVKELEDMGPILTDLVKKWELNPNAKPSNKVAH
ncbi:hypothetical protein C8J57DRAFT_1538105 [Mycena rebaudengoi]|nr:hypothetical protein C8J57DRAFT_1538105 [Mycena rebaudengoi]